MKVHLMLDSVYTNNFIKTLIEQGRIKDNKILIIQYSDIKYIEERLKKDIILIKRKKGVFRISKEYKFLCSQINGETEVYIHYLATEFVWTVIGTNAKEYNWSLWGGDFYPYCNLELYDNETKKLIDKIKKGKNNSLKSRFQEYVSLKLRKKAIDKIDFMLTWNHFDYNMVYNQFSSKAKFKYFVYPKQNNYELLDKLYNESENNKKNITIQLGNSGDYTNNHISMLRQLSKYKETNNFTILAPLAYGDEEYIAEVIKEGKKIFGDRFQPMTGYIPLEEYYKLLNNVDVAIMNHFRQQGAGNIVTLLYLGKKIYLNKEITTYNTFKEWGLNIYNIDSIVRESFNDFININKKEIQENRIMIKQKFNNDAIF